MSQVLVVDDQAPFVRLVQRWVEAEGDVAITASSAEQGLLIAVEQQPAVALCDLHLPGGRNGFWLVEQLDRLCPDTAIMITTGMHGFDARGVRARIAEYLVKPFLRDQFRDALARTTAEHRRRASDRQAEGHRVPAADATVAALMEVVRSEDEQSAQHGLRVAKLGWRLGVEEPELSHIAQAAFLRDVTRVDVHAIARNVPFLSAASAIAVAMAERFDGTGFPLGLKGDAIPLGARILGVAEAYDHLVSRRDARTRLSPEEALDTLTNGRAHEFDPVVLRALGTVPLNQQTAA